MLLYTKEEMAIANILYRFLKKFHHSWLLLVISAISSRISYLTSKTEPTTYELQSTQLSKKSRKENNLFINPSIFQERQKYHHLKQRDETEIENQYKKQNLS